ncbi:hypothetical protein [Catenuloplanes japonicus]|uniref:hypothetical protein n=1 Tax=Catenuloplanes japonicus TaxID=33876 RepID=UPI000B29FCA5|nr:hypothetical protein [Catenuloplanes japonicus]
MESILTPVRVMSALAVEERSWFDIPAVQVIGAIAGALFLVVAIKSMFGGGKR